MKKLSAKEAAISVLKEWGYREVPTTSTKYVKFVYEGMRGITTIWVGKKGAVRQGRTISNSWSITAKIHAHKAYLRKRNEEAGGTR